MHVGVYIYLFKLNTSLKEMKLIIKVLVMQAIPHTFLAKYI